MEMQGTERRSLYTRLHKAIIARISVTAALVVTLGIYGLLTVTLAGSVANEPGASVPTYLDILRSSSRPGATPIPVRTPTPVPSPSPTGPLPPLLSQAIATLQAKNRLLYSGNASLAEIALSVDAGPIPYYPPLILDTRKKYNVKAIFGLECRYCL